MYNVLNWAVFCVYVRVRQNRQLLYCKYGVLCAHSHTNIQNAHNNTENPRKKPYYWKFSKTYKWIHHNIYRRMARNMMCTILFWKTCCMHETMERVYKTEFKFRDSLYHAIPYRQRSVLYIYIITNYTIRPYEMYLSVWMCVQCMRACIWVCELSYLCMAVHYMHLKIAYGRRSRDMINVAKYWFFRYERMREIETDREIE